MRLCWDDGALGYTEGKVKQWVRKYWGDEKSLRTGFASYRSIALAITIWVVFGEGGGMAAAVLSNNDASWLLIVLSVFVGLLGWTIMLLMWLGQHWNGRMHSVIVHCLAVHGRNPDRELDAIVAYKGHDWVICWGDSAAKHRKMMDNVHP